MNSKNLTGCFCDSIGCFYQQNIKTTKKYIKELRERKNHTNSFILVHSYTKSYIQFPETSGYPLSNKKPCYKHTTTKEVILILSSTLTSFGTSQSHHRSEHPLTMWKPVLTELQMKKEIGLITPGTNQIKVHNKSYFTLRKISKALSNFGENLISQTDLVSVNSRSIKQNIYTPISNWKTFIVKAKLVSNHLKQI